MKLYIDSAIIEEVKEISSWGILSGATTNPSLIAASGKVFKETILEICDLVKAPVSVEVTAETVDGMVEEGKEFAGWHDDIVIKLPITTEGLKACNILANAGINTNLTLCFSANQALLCARAGASYVSPFIGRLEDIGGNGISLIREIKEIYEEHDIETEIISASIRTPDHVTQSALAGAHIGTIPYKIFKLMLSHPLTDSGLVKFLEDWKKVQKI